MQQQILPGAISMNELTHHILQSALGLPDTDRAEIAAILINSLDTETDEDADEAWAAEIKRRIELTDRGESTLIPWDDVIQEMRQQRDGT